MSSTSLSQRGPLFKRSFSKNFPVAARGEGVWIFDEAGKKYLDFAGSAAVNFIGHGVAAIGEAMAEQAARLEFVHSSQFVTQLAEDFAQEVLEFAGPAFAGGAVHFTSGGSEAIDAALKLARQYQVEVGQLQRYRVISRKQGYHGATLGALAVSGNQLRRKMYLPMVREFPQIALPYCYRCAYDCKDCARQYAQELDTAIVSCEGEAAAFILEPLSGATLGAVAPPKGYLRDIAGIAKRHGILLIADEVMSGWGRTGRNLAMDHWEIQPDITAVAKGLTSGYAPLGAVIAGAKVVDAIANGSGAFIHGYTYNAHPVALAAGREVLREIRTRELVHDATSDRRASAATQPNRPDVDIKTAGHALRHELEKLRELPSVGDVRGMGLLWGVEFVRDKASKAPFDAALKYSARVAEGCAKRGVMVYPMQGCIDGTQGDHLLLAPPAVITDAEIAWAVEQLGSAIAEAVASV
jgi:adenosylmethionine-8-amino-7-oxononanoate aminotransferase